LTLAGVMPPEMRKAKVRAGRAWRGAVRDAQQQRWRRLGSIRAGPSSEPAGEAHGSRRASCEPDRSAIAQLHVVLGGFQRGRLFTVGFESEQAP